MLTAAVARAQPARARHRRHAVRLLPGLRRRCGRERRAPRQGRRRCGQARGRRADGLARARDRRRRDPGHGPPRPDAAVGDDARRHEGAGPHGDRGARGSSPTRASSRRPAASRSCSRRCPARIGGARDRGARRSRPSASAPAAGCDGQVLVWHDLLGINEGVAPRFVKRYADVAGEIRRGLEAFAAEVRSGAYPADEHAYKISAEELRAFEAELDDDGRSGRLDAPPRCARSPRRSRPRPPRRARRTPPASTARSVAGAQREDHVAVEHRVRRADADGERVVAELGQLAAPARSSGASVATTTSVVFPVGGDGADSAPAVTRARPSRAWMSPSALLTTRAPDDRAVRQAPRGAARRRPAAPLGAAELRDRRAGPGARPGPRAARRSPRRRASRRSPHRRRERRRGRRRRGRTGSRRARSGPAGRRSRSRCRARRAGA